MFALVKPFLIAVTIVMFLLYAIGIIRFEKTTYSCFHGKKLRFAQRVKLADLGSLQLYGYPLIADCPDNERYDPRTVYKCGEQLFCQKQP